MNKSELIDFVKKANRKNFNKHIKDVPSKIEANLSSVPSSEKESKLPGIMTVQYSVAALDASTDTLLEVLEELNLLD